MRTSNSLLVFQPRARKLAYAGCLASTIALACSGSGQSSSGVGALGGSPVATGGRASTELSSGGVAPTGSKQGSGGITGVPTSGGTLATTGGSATAGTSVATGGTSNTGGNQATGGSNPTSGGANTTGGRPETGGTLPTSSTSVTGGSNAAGGSLTSGGKSSTGGASSGGDTAAGGASVSGPCDIFVTGNTPCVAAHSTVRLLSSTYRGPLYQVRRASDGKTQDIAFVAKLGAADSASQDTFCTGSKCTISVVYDQSGKGNDLKRSQGGAEVCKHQDQEAVADALPLTLGGHKVYGIKVVSDDSGPCTPPPGGEGTGYRLNATSGIATGDDAETEYMVTSGDYSSYQNSGCCFDYGNAETTSKDDGAATMEAIYFGGGAGWGHGGGNGPWVMADMENGIFSGQTNAYAGNTSVPYAYVTAVLIGRSGGTYALKAGNSQAGNLVTMYDGPRPSGYTKMKKQGAIVLGTGGDNSDHGRGYFFEGVMTAGAATDAIMNLVQANIVAAGYGK